MRKTRQSDGSGGGRRRLGTLMSLVVLLSIAGIALATWLVDGSGFGAAEAGVVEDLIVTPGTPGDLLYPGGDPASVAVDVENLNTYPVLVTSFTQTPSEEITSDNPACTPDVHGVTFTDATGSWLIAPGQKLSLQLAGAASMAVDSAEDCEGVTFLIPLTATGQASPVVDADGDGFASDVDCDDADPFAYPGAPEIAGDGIDNNCDGTTDEG